MTLQFKDLLLEILHADPSRPTLCSLKLLSANDWRAFVDEAIHFRLAHQIQQFLQAEPERLQLIPKAEADRLSESVRATVMHNLRQQRRLHKMLTACQAAGLPVLLVKGLWLAHVVYRDIKARPSGDIDLLVHREDMPALLDILSEQGFRPPVDATTLDNLLAHEHELTINHPDDGACFDIHWSLTRPGEDMPIDEAKFWQRAETFSLAGQPCLSLSLEDHLLYLCFHTALHHQFLYVGPRALLDVANLIAHPPRAIDWNLVQNRAYELGWQRGTWLTLALVNDYLGVSTPSAVLERLKPSNADALPIKAAALEAIFLGQQIHDSLTPNIVRLLDEPSWRNRAAILSRKICPPKEVIASLFQAEAGVTCIYSLYLKHWRRLCQDHFFKLIRLSAGERNHASELKRAKLIKQWLES